MLLPCVGLFLFAGFRESNILNKCVTKGASKFSRAEELEFNSFKAGYVLSVFDNLVPYRLQLKAGFLYYPFQLVVYCVEIFVFMKDKLSRSKRGEIAEALTRYIFLFYITMHCFKNAYVYLQFVGVRGVKKFDANDASLCREFIDNLKDIDNNATSREDFIRPRQLAARKDLRDALRKKDPLVYLPWLPLFTFSTFSEDDIQMLFYCFLWMSHF